VLCCGSVWGLLRHRSCHLISPCLLRRGGGGGKGEYKAVLILSVGVTATTLSTQPAIIPANIPEPFERWPFSSASAFLIESNVKNRTDALNAVPTTRVVQPVYSAERPSVRTMSRIRMSGFLVIFVADGPVPTADVEGVWRSCILVFANSNGYYFSFIRDYCPDR
jgi:hypothetical protein